MIFAKYLAALLKANLQAAVEFRWNFLLQVLGMLLNNTMYFVFWVLFFDRFTELGGWGLADVALLIAVTAAAFGLAVMVAGNVFQLSAFISEGKLDYYLTTPHPVLPRVLMERMIVSGFGDVVYGVGMYLIFGREVAGFARFLLMAGLGAVIFTSFLTAMHSLSFWMGNARAVAGEATTAVISFAMYPTTLFDKYARLLLHTVVPAALIGAVPAVYVRTGSDEALAQVFIGAGAFAALAVLLFSLGLRRYESGSMAGTRG